MDANTEDVVEDDSLSADVAEEVSDPPVDVEDDIEDTAKSTLKTLRTRLQMPSKTSGRRCTPGCGATTLRSAFGYRCKYGLAHTTVVLKPSGGTGAYRFELLNDASGALLDEVAGLHVLGATIGAVDAVEVSDLGCVGTTETTVEVIERFTVEPSQIQVGTGGSFQFVVTKGSGLFEFNFLTNASGGSLSADGMYTAGAFEGVDAIEIVDIGAGTVETAGVVVLEDASIQVQLAADVLLQGQPSVCRSMVVVAF